MDRARQQRGQLVQLEEERLAAKREAYLRRVNPTRPLSSAEEELTARYRRRKVWLHVVTFAAISNRWHQQLVQTKHLVWMAKVNGKAASTIQRIWRKWKWRHASKHTVVVYTWLRKCLWKLLLKVRCRRKARHAALIRQFMLTHLTESHATRNFNRMMVHWRSKVIRAQQAGMYVSLDEVLMKYSFVLIPLRCFFQVLHPLQPRSNAGFVSLVGQRRPRSTAHGSPTEQQHRRWTALGSEKRLGSQQRRVRRAGVCRRASKKFFSSRLHCAAGRHGREAGQHADAADPY
jgi:hypothetical protein